MYGSESIISALGQLMGFGVGIILVISLVYCAFMVATLIAH